MNKSSVKDGIKERKKRAKICVKRKIVPVFYFLFFFVSNVLHARKQYTHTHTSPACISLNLHNIATVNISHIISRIYIDARKSGRTDAMAFANGAYVAEVVAVDAANAEKP